MIKLASTLPIKHLMGKYKGGASLLKETEEKKISFPSKASALNNDLAYSLQKAFSGRDQEDI